LIYVSIFSYEEKNKDVNNHQNEMRCI